MTEPKPDFRPIMTLEEIVQALVEISEARPEVTFTDDDIVEAARRADRCVVPIGSSPASLRADPGGSWLAVVTVMMGRRLEYVRCLLRDRNAPEPEPVARLPEGLH